MSYIYTVEVKLIYDHTWARNLRTVHHVFIYPEPAGRLNPNHGFKGMYSDLEESKVEEDMNEIKKDMINKDEKIIDKKDESLIPGFTQAKNPSKKPNYSPLINEEEYESEWESER